MTPQENLETENGRIRVSILERLIPNLSYSIAGIGAGATALFLLFALNGLVNSATQGIGSFSSALTNALTSLEVGLILAILMGVVAIVVKIIMMVTTRKTASPSFIHIVVAGFIALIPVVITYLITFQMLWGPILQNNLLDYKGVLYAFLVVAAFLGFLTPVIGVVMSLIPATSRPGRKIAPLILMVVFEAVMLILVVVIFYQLSAFFKYASRY